MRRRSACAVRPIAACILALCWLASSVPAAEPPAFVVRTRIEPAGGVAIGQPVTLYVDVFTDLFFTSGVELPPLDIPGALVELSADRPLHISDTIDGTSMFGIERAYRITPIVGVDLTIPAFEVSARAGPRSMQLSATTQALTLQVSVPDGAEGAFVTHDLQIEQKTDLDVGKLEVGDAFTRSIELTATGTPGMFIPDVEPARSPSLKAYPQPPVIADSGPGEPLVGKRTFAVTYVVQQPGDVELPAVEVRWWDLDTNEAKVAQAPAVAIHAAASPPPPAPFEIPAEAPPAPASKPIPRQLLLASLGTAIAFALTLRWLWPIGRRGIRRLEDHLTVRRRRYLNSERHAFAELCSALHGRNAGAIASALYRWLDRLPTATARHGASVVDPSVLPQMKAWIEARYAADAVSTAPHGLIDEVKHARRRLLKKTPSATHERRLPALNP